MDPVNRLKAKIVLVSAAAVLFTGSVSADPLIDSLANIIDAIYGVAAGIAALLIVLQAIKYKTAAGPAEREEAKKGIINVIVGLAIIMVAGYMVGLIYYVEPVKTPSTIPKSTATTRIYVTTPTPTSTTTTITTSTTTTTTGPSIDALTILFVPLNYQSTASFKANAQTAFNDIKAKFPVSECPDPDARIKAIYMDVSECRISCSDAYGCFDTAYQCGSASSYDYDYIIGMTPTDYSDICGLASVPGRVFWMGATCLGQRTQLHEFGHNFELYHITGCLNPAGACMGPNAADCNEPDKTTDWMTYCFDTRYKWGPAGYNHLKNNKVTGMGKWLQGC